MKYLFLLRRLPLLLLSVISGFSSFSQNAFFEVLANESSRSNYTVKPAIQKYSLFRLDEEALRAYLADAPMQFQQEGNGIPLDIPFPDGHMEKFYIKETPLLAPHVAAQHPDFKTYTGVGVRFGEQTIRFSLTSVGFGGIILHVKGKTVYFESYQRGSGLYVSYFTSDAYAPGRTPSYQCGVDGPHEDPMHPHMGEGPLEYRNNTGALLRTYNLAIAATGEFTQHTLYGNGSVTDAYAVIVNYANNMAGVYSSEMCVSFTLVSGTSVVYSNPASDPYDNNDQGSMLDDNVTVLNDEIGESNYDVGHVFGYAGGSGGGVAAAGSVCYDPWKGQGVSGMGNGSYPQSFNDQLVYHEVGHQFGMSHSYNSSIPVCETRNPGTSVEPGAGATIMSYGFTCGSDDYENIYGPVLQFHSISYSQAYTYFTNTNEGYGGSCPLTNLTGNHLPVLTMPAAKTIPKSTPFSLTGSATDSDGDALTYCWEGTNIGTEVPGNGTLADKTKPPFFRSYDATDSGTRYYPRLEKVLDQTYSGKGDKLPSVGVATTHRMTVRDNNGDGGATVYGAVTITVDGSAGPFFVYNISNSYAPGASVLIEWDIAGTTAAPVSCAQVNILLSTDGGYNFPTTLAANTTNDGSQTISLPNINTTTARIMVRCSNNYFFDITNEFEIQGPLPVEWLEFSATLKNKRDALLQWETATETNNAGFEVEISGDAGRTFKKAGFVAAAPERSYQYTVTGLEDGEYYFRLQQIDHDGTVSYSPIRSLRIGQQQSELSVFPNPAQQVLTVQLPQKREGDLTLQVLNQMSQVLRTLTVSADQALVQIGIEDLPAGIYVLEVRFGGVLEAIRFSKEKI
ncbi:MAG: T9SS type A sorting domain-containing protein [Saprospiraceae bacterium]|nr:T9SS type A sorting domain-containing protein [Saprospiraceae bacterium]